MLKFPLISTNSATVFSYLFVLLARSSLHEPRIHDQGLLVPGLSENTNTVYCQPYTGHSKTAIKRWGDFACFRPGCVPARYSKCLFLVRNFNHRQKLLSYSKKYESY